MDPPIPDTLTRTNVTNNLKSEGAIFQNEARTLKVLDIKGYHTLGDKLFTKPNGAMASRITALDISIPPGRGVLFWDYHSILSHFPNLSR